MANKQVSVMPSGTNNFLNPLVSANRYATDFVSNGVVGTTTNTAGVAPTTGAFGLNAQGSPNMTVAVNGGVLYVNATPSGGVAGTYAVTMDAAENVTINSNSSGSTVYDFVYMQLSASGLNNPDTQGLTVATLITSRSTTAYSGGATGFGNSNGVIANALLIGVVTVINNAVSISNSSINDVRTVAGITSLAPSVQAPRFGETGSTFVVSGLNPTVPGSLVVVIPAGIAYINGVRTVSSGGTLTVSANQDTYVDMDSTGGLFPTGQANNTASPALVAGRVRLMIIVSGGSAVSSINQGSVAATAPVISSNVIQVTDSLGNLIYPTDPNARLIGRRGPLSGGTAGVTSYGSLVPTPVIVPAGRKIKGTCFLNWGNFNTSQNATMLVSIVEDATTTRALGKGWMNGSTAQSNAMQPTAVDVWQPTAGFHTYTISASYVGGYQMSAYDSGTIIIELV